MRSSVQRDGTWEATNFRAGNKFIVTKGMDVASGKMMPLE
jgi:hypothetical protein